MGGLSVVLSVKMRRKLKTRDKLMCKRNVTQTEGAGSAVLSWDGLMVLKGTLPQVRLGRMTVGLVRFEKGWGQGGGASVREEADEPVIAAPNSQHPPPPSFSCVVRSFVCSGKTLVPDSSIIQST